MQFSSNNMVAFAHIFIEAGSGYLESLPIQLPRVLRIRLKCELFSSGNHKTLKTKGNTYSKYTTLTRWACDTFTETACLTPGGRAFVLEFALDAHRANLSET